MKKYLNKENIDNLRSSLVSKFKVTFNYLKECLLKIDVENYVVLMTILAVFVSPTFFFEDIFKIDVTKYLFLAFSIIMYISLLLKDRSVDIYEKFMLIIIILICIIQCSIVPLSLIELILIYRILGSLYEKRKVISFKKLLLGFLGVIFYSIIYFNFNGRFMYTGLREINQSSFAILMLGILLRKSNKKLGNIILILGLFTFSRNYLLGLLVFVFLELIKKTKFYDWLYRWLSFKNLAILSVMFLVLLAAVFESAYKNDKLSEYKEGFARYVSIFDYSNYFRFTTNTNLIKLYVDKPQKLLTGVEEKEFYDYTFELSKENNGRYRAIKPHNYFFSYFRIYGIFAFGIFIFLNKILKQIITKNNFSVFVSIFVYAILLGIGFANYWLFLSVITLLNYKEGEEYERGYNNNKNFSTKKSFSQIIKIYRKILSK